MRARLTRRSIGRSTIGSLALLATIASVSGTLAAEPPATLQQPLVDPAEPPEKAAEDPVVFERVRVVGAPDRSAKIPGSVAYLAKARLEQQNYADIHRVLREIPGINLQEEEGYGLRPNIGMRGSGA